MSDITDFVVGLMGDFQELQEMLSDPEALQEHLDEVRAELEEKGTKLDQNLQDSGKD